MRIKPEHDAAYAWAESHFNDGRTADDFAQEAVDAAGQNFDALRVADEDAQLLAAVKANPAMLAQATVGMGVKGR